MTIDDTIKRINDLYLKDKVSKPVGNTFKIYFWKIVCWFWQPQNWTKDALHYVREHYPEELLMDKIFDERGRFFRPRWYWVQLVCLTLPKKEYDH